MNLKNRQQRAKQKKIRANVMRNPRGADPKRVIQILREENAKAGAHVQVHSRQEKQRPEERSHD